MPTKYHCLDCGKPLHGKFFCCYACNEYKARVAREAELYDGEEHAEFLRKENLSARIVLGAIRGQVRAKEIEKDIEETHAREAQEAYHIEPIYGTGLSILEDGMHVHHMMGVAEEVL